MPDFTPLRVHSHGSLLYGTASPEALIARALSLGYRALALTDRDNLYLAIRFWKTAKSQGLRPLLGCTLSNGSHEALLLPADRRGWANLCELITRRHLEPRFDLVAALAPDGERALHSGLHIVVESSGLAASLVAAGVPPAAGADTRARSDGREAGLWMGVRGIAAERQTLEARIDAARRLGLPLVATGDVVLLERADHDAHRAAVTAAAGELIERMPESAFCAADAGVAAPDAWVRRMAAVCTAARSPHAATEALANNVDLVARCRLELDLGTPIFPRATLAAGETGIGRLRGQCEAGLAWRYPLGDVAARERLRTELEMIERMGFTDYFLLVAEIVGFARDRGIPSVGRGSGASSIVAYSLGITNVDPIAQGLAFERFLNPTRRDCPDLDIDLCWWRRDDVINHVYERYGHDRVAMISTHSTLGARSAFRETAKVLGVPNARVNALARRIPRDLEKPYAQHLRALPHANDVDWTEPPLARALELAERLDGAPRHLSVHSGGVVIADRPLTYYVPLERAAKDVVVTQFEMRAIEAIGLVKMDLLGNRALSTIAECIELVRDGAAEALPAGHAHAARYAQAAGRADTAGYAQVAARAYVAESTHTTGRANLSTDMLPGPDAATSELIAAGDTLTCFQLESPAMRHLLRMLNARTLDDVVAAVALVRPGPAESGMKEAYCRRARGLEPASYAHPRLEAVLGGAYGVMLYEEDVLRVGAALTGLSLAEGDDLRRAIGAARTDDEFRSLERGFVTQAVHSGVDAVTAHSVWCDLARFGAYAFCKAHAAGYGALGWHCAWLRTHHPTEFAVAILNHHAGMYATWVHVEDLRRRGVRFLAPCVARSALNTTLEREDFGRQPVRPGDAAAAPHRSASRTTCSRAVRVGLSRVFGLHEVTVGRIVAARGALPFRSLADFIDRVRPSLPEAESLIHAGALDSLGRTRPSLLLEARAGARGWSQAGALRSRVNGAVAVAELLGDDGLPLRPIARSPINVPTLPEFGVAERVRLEAASTGMWFTAHPLDVLVSAEALRGTVPASEVERHIGRRITVAGLPCASRGVETKKGERMQFITLADHSGLAECVLFPDTYRRFGHVARAEVVRAEGRVDETLGAFTVTVDRAWGFGTLPLQTWSSGTTSMSRQ